MSLYLERRVGSYVLDRSFPGVGRIKLTTGTKRRAQAERLAQMVQAIYDLHRVDVLKAIRLRVVTLAEVWAIWRLGQHARLPTVESIKPLEPTVFTWADRADCSEGQRRNHRQSFRNLLAGEPAGATMADLPILVRSYKGRARGKVAFNRCRATVQSFLRDTLGRRHPLYAEVADIPLYTVKAAPGVKQSVEEVRALAAALGAWSGMAWSLVLSGMRRGEYWGLWEVLPDRYRIFGTKTAASRRDVPNLGTLVRPLVGYQAFRRRLSRVTGGEVTSHDFRHTYTHWMELARVPRSRRKLYLGHGARDVQDIYELHELDRFLAEDRERMLGLVGPVPLPLRLVG